MSKTFRNGALAAFLAFLVWRNGRPMYNVLVKPPLPASYFSGGNASTSCETILLDTPITSCEDGIFWNVPAVGKEPAEKRLLLSCDAGRKKWNTVMGPLLDPNPRGALWLYTYEQDPTSKGLHQLPLEGFPATSDFHPLGIDIITPSATEPATLFVINHQRDQTTLEQFKIPIKPPYKAIYIRTLVHPAFVSPNGLALISPTSFYVGNDHRFTRRLPFPLAPILPLLESFLGLPLSWVDLVDILPSGELKVTRALSSIPFVNGVALSEDGQEMAVVSTTTGQVHIYDRTVSQNGTTLALRTKVMVPFLADNINYVDGTRTLVTAGHPYMFSLDKLAQNAVPYSDGWVVSIIPRNGHHPASADDLSAIYPVSKRVPQNPEYEVKTLYQTDGRGFGTTTTGMVDEKTGALFATGLYTPGLLRCQIS